MSRDHAVDWPTGLTQTALSLTGAHGPHRPATDRTRCAHTATAGLDHERRETSSDAGQEGVSKPVRSARLPIDSRVSEGVTVGTTRVRRP